MRRLRRADRLFQIIQLLRRKRVVTAAKLARELEVSERTIYRDLRDLMARGTPIEGEPGVGYRLRREYDLPPLMFEPEEIEALVLGARIVASAGDERLAKASRAVLAKVETVLPKKRRHLLQSTALYAPARLSNPAVGKALEAARHAVSARVKLRLSYRRADGESSTRTIRPLAAFFWGKVWTLVAWCELREDFRNFRLDRMGEFAITDEVFAEEKGKMLADYLASVDQHALSLLED